MKRTASEMLHFLTDEKDVREWIGANLTVTGTLTVDPDGVVDVDGSVWPLKRGLNRLKRLMVKFGRVTGNFTLSETSMENILGAPDSVGSCLICENMHLLSTLKDGPNDVGEFVIVRYCPRLRKMDLPMKTSDIRLLTDNERQLGEDYNRVMKKL